MDTAEVQKCLKVIFGKRGQYDCIPCDKLDTIRLKSYPFAYCVNDEVSGQPGMHWVGVYVHARRKPLEFFCSYGRSIKTYPKYFLDFAHRNKLSVLEKNACIQSLTSTVCGNHVLHFFYQRSKGCSRKCFYAKFSKNVVKNDEIVTEFLKKLKKRI